MIIKKLKQIIKNILCAGLISLTMLSMPLHKAYAMPTSDKNIMIDYAHKDSVNDVGASVIHNGKAITELEIVTKITTGVIKELENKGFNITTTRDINESMGLSDRVYKANKYPYDYYISIHANTTEEKVGTATGVETFSNSVSLSEKLLSNISSDLNMLNRGNKEDIYYTTNIKNDSVLLECGFMNNEEDLLKLINNKDKYIKSIVDAIVLEYKENGIHIEAEELYRVKDRNGNQIGAFKNKQNAIRSCKDGYKIIDNSGKIIHLEVN